MNNPTPARSRDLTVQCTSALDEETRKLRVQYSDLWKQTLEKPVSVARVYTRAQKRENEGRMEKLLRDAERRQKSRNGIDQSIGRLRDYIRDLVLETIDERKRGAIERVLTTFADAGDDFVRKCREFDTELRFDGIFQALRNLWIINSMQEAFGLSPRTNPSALAYSLLYTYSDNFLDSESVSLASKLEFGHLFGQRLSGTNIPETSDLLVKISSLVALIEEEYPRTLFPDVFMSLLAIHRAQLASLKQRLDPQQQDHADVLSISVEKGGTSVVADAFVAKGCLTTAETSFAFGYGVFLQFVDDLQDVKEDSERGSETLFTQALENNVLDGITNRLIHYIHRIMVTERPLNGPRAEALTELILQGSVGLILESIALHPEYFSADYVRHAELLSPLAFEAIRNMHSRRSSLERDFQASACSHLPLNRFPIKESPREKTLPPKFGVSST